jgi:hypothetical protein
MSNYTIERKFDVRRLVNATTDKRGRQLKPFETPEQAQEELRHRLRLLCDNSNDDLSLEIAFFLANCSNEFPCGSLVCPRCARVRRIHSAASILEFFGERKLRNLNFLTLTTQLTKYQWESCTVSTHKL